MSRADKITIEKKKVEYYSDFLNNFDKNPLTGFLAKVTNEEAVKQSIKNLVLTGTGERFFQPALGSTVRYSLFDLLTTETLLTIRESIRDTINNFEPRAILHEVVVLPRPDGNAVLLKVVFSIRNYTDEAFTLDLVVNRVR